ncbi:MULTISPECIES: phosphoenolpyruvate--protein phosphotransferase [unclassified Azospirillum]|uniref:phosphoenolpyruvate--protein phosphotransferase n=1 Tax=unclassified Azospirillum TaxID=2630922 RepID=UPI000B74555E|nr:MULTISPECIES: phosphoenolpyruvate--protein phosphotransferase [unclassified Azospirillum]SNR95492.1 Phosphocarrier protein HPr /phosphoenolpyruvate--protein phosphotransferase /PTS system IIA component, Glc family [Azospirillum sp. RU38E]SNS11963.1 Phosphocarrier protein HPr /phosphoenolpyruvate--protein phosphotransferase /PTS system IIA component, Glc family [Azospirillum sp. RU37A]
MTPPTNKIDGIAGASIAIGAPLTGWLTVLDEVPDAVFASRMLGDGVAIDPTGDCLVSPCDGEVSALNASGHAVTIRIADGAEILMHIGIDTVALAGRGFTPCVRQGDRVKRGDVLIRFDLDAIVQAAPAVVTPVLLLETDRFTLARTRDNGPVKAGDYIFTLTAKAAEAGTPAEAATGATLERRLLVPLAHGIHARPAARIKEALSGFSASVTIAKAGKAMNARSPVGLLTLGIRLGDEVSISAQGADAAEALATLGALIDSGMGEKADPASAPKAQPVAPVAAPVAQGTAVLPADGKLAGVTASPGLAVGQARAFRLPEIQVAPTGQGAAVEQARLEAARAELGRRLEAEAAHASGPQKSIIQAHRAMLDDDGLLEAASLSIGDGASAGHAWRAAVRPQAAALRATGDAHLAERADDMLDLERRVLAVLEGVADEPLSFPPGTVLVAEDLLPSQLMALDKENVVGFVVERGGPTSHVAILAASMGLPALVAIGPALHQVADGTDLILDATGCTLHVAPDAATLAAARDRLAVITARRAAAKAAAGKPCHTADGVRIEVFANLGSEADAKQAVANGAEGSGLLRTEFLFLERATAPTVAEQTADYQSIATALEGRPLIVRLLDIGGDKPAPYLPIPAEENPALGLRGIRVGFAYPTMLEDQIRAILSVQPVGQCRIMVPMIAGVDELRRVRAVLDRVRTEMGITDKVELGVMVETPAAAVTADLLAAEADFLSIGTNDLTQYALAMDRGNAAVAGSIDGLHPSVLRLIAQTCQGAARHGKWTGVCGSLASDPLAVPILVGLGVAELSATPAIVPEIKALVSALTLEQARAHAAAALECATAADVRTLARGFSA